MSPEIKAVCVFVVKHREWGKKDAEGNEIPHALGKDCWCNPEVRKI